MAEQIENFELNYLFDEKKNIFHSLEKVKTIYETLYEYDKLLVRHIYQSVNIEYSLIDLEYSSFKSKVEQLLKSIPDELLKKPDLKTLMGLFLIKAKYWLLKKVSENKTIDTKEQISELTDKINKELRSLAKDQKLISTDVSNYQILDLVTRLSIDSNNLEEKETYQYKSKFGNAILKKGHFVDKVKILSELGAKNETSETTEIIKPKRIDLLSDETKWSCVLKGRTVPIKIIDKIWLDKYHKRAENISPGDTLKVSLKTTYEFNPNNPKTNISYEVTKVIEVINPSENSENTLL